MHAHDLRAVPRGFLACAALLAVCCPTVSADVWTAAQPILSLHGSGDILAGATSGGVVLWDVPRARAEWVSTARGLPSHVTHAIELAAGLDQAGVATDNGVARGWFGSTWQNFAARNDEEGASWTSSFGNPAGGYVFGGARGALLAWRHDRVDSLRVPTRGGRVVDLDVAPYYFDVQAHGRRNARLTSAPAFPSGLVAALDNDGVWLLRRSGSAPRWLRIDDMDGLPSRYVRDVAVDANGFIWVATRRGLARVGPGVRVTTFADSLLSGRIEALLWDRNDRLHLGVEDGIVEFDTSVEPPRPRYVVRTEAPVIALAATNADIWWTSGARVRSLGGVELPIPGALAANASYSIAALDDTVWVGHTLGRISRNAAGGWTHHGTASGLPSATVESFLRVNGTLYVGTEDGLYVHRPSVSPDGDGVQFTRVEGVTGAIRAQAVWDGIHWVGGAEGTWRHDGATWSSVALWPEAHEIHALAVLRDTLWATAGTGGVRCDGGSGWQRPPVLSNLAGAYWGRVHVSSTDGMAFATDRGVAVRDAGILRPADGTPVEFIHDVAWWDDVLAAGGNRGLWLRNGGTWTRHGVFDALPGARVRSLDVTERELWVASTRGVGRFWRSDFACVEQRLRLGHTVLDVLPPTSARRVVVTHGRRLRLNLAHEATPTLRLDLHDVRGRLIRTLHTRTPGAFTWDLRDAKGRPVPNGAYFGRVRSRTASTPPVCRVLVLR